MIIPHELIRHRVTELYEAGGFPPGDPCGWPSVDRLYTVGMNQWTLVTGTPNSGKSEWLDALMVNLARTGNWRFCIFSPENLPVELHHSKILEKYLGKPFGPGPTPRIERDELEEGEDWMHGKFHFLKPASPDIVSILVEAREFTSSAHSPQWKLGVIIDPWNYLEHHRPQFMSETEYVSDTLSQVIACVRENYMHLWLVAHPAKQTPKKDGTYAVPTPRDVSGSAHFWNKSDNCVTIWRDQVDGNKEVEVHVQKIRFKHIGHIGIAKLAYDRVTGRYREELKAVEKYANDYADR